MQHNNILTFHSCAFFNTVAILSNEKIIFSESSDNLSSSPPLVAMIENALSRAYLKPQDLSCIATLKGPGSFTGLRNSLAVAKAFSISLSVPVMAVNAFDFVYYTNNLSGAIGIVLESGRDEAFCAVLNKIDNFIKPPECLQESLFKDYFDKYTYIDTRNQPFPKADSLAYFVNELLSECVPIYDNLSPLYLREAEINASRSTIP